MAEIGLIASVIQVAGFGAAVAKNLYDAADVLYHAKPQILALAKHVSQFTAVLKRMSEVLDAEKANCSKKVLKDIRAIKRSCKKTLKEIEATVKSKRSRHFIPIKWLFQKSKALELESRLDSHQSMLQCIIHTLTVSKLSTMDARAKEDSSHIVGLKDEITLLKAFIMESYANLEELRRNETASMHSNKAQKGFGNSFPEDNSEAVADYEEEDDDSQRASASSKKEAQIAKRLDQDAKVSLKRNAKDLSVTISGDKRIHQNSDYLLHMIPYRPVKPISIASDRLLGANPDAPQKNSLSSRPTETVRLLLDKWTVSGSTPISKILDEESSKEAEEKSDPEFMQRTSDAREGHHDLGDERDSTKARYRERSTSRERIRPYHLSPLAPRRKAFWTYSFGNSADIVLSSLRQIQGGIYFIKTNRFWEAHYVDERMIYRCELLPSPLIPADEQKASSSELWVGQIRKEALELLDYSFQQTSRGTFSIQGNLSLDQIEELVRLSFQALDRHLLQKSEALIKGQGLQDSVRYYTEAEASDPYSLPRRQGFGRQPIIYPDSPFTAGPSPSYQPYPHNDYYPQPRNYPYEYSSETLPVTRGRQMRHNADEMTDVGYSERHFRSGSLDAFDRVPYSRRSYSPPEEPSSSMIVPRATPTNPPTREVRFTIPGARMASSPEQQDTFMQRLVSEIDMLRTQLRKLELEKYDAEKSMDHAVASDLQCYAIPDLQARIKEKENEKNEVAAHMVTNHSDAMSSTGAVTRTSNAAPPTETETESEDTESEDDA